MIAEQVSADDLCLYAMGLLDDSASAQIAEFLQDSTEGRTELERVRGDLALLAFTAEPIAPSPALRKRILREIAREAKPSPATTAPVETAHIAVSATPARTAATAEAAATKDVPLMAPIPEETWLEDSYTPSTERLPAAEDSTATKRISVRVSLWVGWGLAAGLAVAVALVGYRIHLLRNTLAASDARATHAADELKRESANAADAEAVWDLLHSGSAQHVLLKGQATKATAQISYLPGKGALVLQAFDTDPLPEGKTYELWLTPQQPDGSSVPAGLFQPDDHGNAMLAIASTAHSTTAHGFAVTVEDVGGSPIPTLPFLLTEQQ